MNGIIQKEIALRVICRENWQCSQDYSDAMEALGRQWFARLENGPHAENYFGKTILY